jgi:hypothetical protein
MVTVQTIKSCPVGYVGLELDTVYDEERSVFQKKINSPTTSLLDQHFH